MTHSSRGPLRALAVVMATEGRKDRFPVLLGQRGHLKDALSLPTAINLAPDVRALSGYLEDASQLSGRLGAN